MLFNEPVMDIIRCLYAPRGGGLENVQDAQLSQRDRAAGCVIVFAKSRRLELGDNIFTDSIGLSSTTVI